MKYRTACPLRAAAMKFPTASGVYVLTNVLTHEQYVGSSHDLRHRVCCWVGKMHRARLTRRSHPVIESAKRCGVSAFAINVLILCDADKLVSQEQHYMDLLKPVLNVQRVARHRISAMHLTKLIEPEDETAGSR